MSNLRYNIKVNNSSNTKTYIYFKPTESNNLDDIKLILENDDSVDLHANNEDINTYKNVTDYIYRIITNTGFLCKGLNPDYILESFYKVDAVVVIGSSMDILPNGNIFGFALIKFDEKTNLIYVDVICSHTGIKGAGDFLINKIESISRNLLMTGIYLVSVKNAISFYKKYGFIKTDELCENMCLMKKSLNKKSNETKTRTKTSKQTKSKKTPKTRKSRG